jgi:hypothetical protein
MRLGIGLSPSISDIVRGKSLSSSLPGPLVQDTFSGESDGTLLTAHTPDIDTVGGGWVDDGATGPGDGDVLAIQSNAVEPDQVAFDSVQRAVVDSGASDVDISLDVTIDSNADGTEGILFRYVDVDNHWQAIWGNGDSVHIWVIDERVSKTYTRRASVAFTPSATTTYSFRVVASGTSITATIDGGYQIAYTSSLYQTATKHGIMGQSRDYVGAPATPPAYDNFVVSAA